MCKGLEESMCLLEALKIVQAVLILKEVEDSERISYRVSIKRLVSQGKKCVLYTKSNREMDSRVLSKGVA